MADLSQEEIFIIEKIKEHGGKINYKELHALCEEKFEGVRLILKKLKEKTYIDYDGIISGFSIEIELLREKEIS